MQFVNFIKRVPLYIVGSVVSLAAIVSIFSVTPQASAEQLCANNSGASAYTWTTTTRTYDRGTFCLQDNNGYRLIFQSDGNLVWYSKTGAVWASNTNATGYYLKFQSDQNVVVYTKGGYALWASSWIKSNWTGQYWYTGSTVKTGCSNRLDLYAVGKTHYLSQGVGCGQMGGTFWEKSVTEGV